jgi:hypothetical protein
VASVAIDFYARSMKLLGYAMYFRPLAQRFSGLEVAARWRRVGGAYGIRNITYCEARHTTR